MRFIVLATFLAATLSGCAWPRGAPLQSEVLAEAQAQEPTFAVVPVTRDTVADIAKWPPTGWAGRYVWLQSSGGSAASVIRPGDAVDLIVWDNQENSLLVTPNAKATPMRDLVVSPQGSIFVPYVGEVMLNGLTPDGARQVVQRQLTRIAPSAQVQLTVRPGDVNSVDLVGGVGRPGPVELKSRNLSILSLIARGGGIQPNLPNPLVRLIRNGHTYEIRADDLMADARRNIVVRGGDKVVVDRDKRYFVAMGTTLNEQLVYFDREHINAMEAISMVGGLNDTRADLGGVLILRTYPEKAVRADGKGGPKQAQVVFSLDLTSADGLFAARAFEVHPNDLIVATESPMVGTTEVLSVVGQVLSVRNRF